MKIFDRFKRKNIYTNSLTKDKDMIPEKECMELNILWDYIDNRLSEEEKEAAEAHFTDCDMCRQEMVTAKLLMNDAELMAESFPDKRDFSPIFPELPSLQTICETLGFKPIISWGSVSLIPAVRGLSLPARNGGRRFRDKYREDITEERRKDSRIKWQNLSYVCTDEKGVISNEGMGRTLDVSEGGILLETPFFIDSNQSLSLAIAVGEDVVNIRGTVTHSRVGKKGMFETGVEFTETKETDLEILRKYIEIFKEKVKTGEWTVDSEYLLLEEEEPLAIHLKKEFDDFCLHLFFEESRMDRFNLMAIISNLKKTSESSASSCRKPIQSIFEMIKGKKKDDALRFFLKSDQIEDSRLLPKGKVETFPSLPFGKYEIVLKQKKMEKVRYFFDISDRGLYEEASGEGASQNQ